MLPEKLDECPLCEKSLGQEEYDGQFCITCGTEPYGPWVKYTFNKPLTYVDPDAPRYPELSE